MTITRPPTHDPAHSSRRLRRILIVGLAAASIAVPGLWAIRAAHGTGSTARAASTPAPATAVRPAARRRLSRATRLKRADRRAHRALAAALSPILAASGGTLAVGVVDLTTGVTVTHDGGRRFHTASIVKADILAALLLRHQATGTPLSEDERELAVAMIEHSDNDAASALWYDIGEGSGLAAANVRLGLRHTTPGSGGYWGLTSTTVADQLRLLTDLTSRRSPLNRSSRACELALMRAVERDQAWGVSAAATSRASVAVKNGWLPDPDLWVINSIGLVPHDGHRLLIAVLSDGHDSEAAGVSACEQAAVAAASAALEAWR